jgi:hypothetical protein
VLVAFDHPSRCDAAHRSSGRGLPVAPASRAFVRETPETCPGPSGDRPFRFGRGRGQNRENERIHFAKRNEAFRLAGHKLLKSSRATNHGFAGSFVFNGLSAVSFRRFSRAAVVAVSNADRQPELSEQTGRILYFRLIIWLILFYTRNCSRRFVENGRGRCEGLLIRAFSLPAGEGTLRQGSGNSGEIVRHNPIPLVWSLSPSALT